jgi:hypothetical protein
MRRTKTKERTDFEILCDELGEEPIRKLYEVYRLTAAAIFRSAKKRAEAEMKMADQYRTLDEEDRRGGER